MAMTAGAQSLNKMTWFNEPASYDIKGNTLVMDVPGHCDYWRISHYGFTVDDAPFYYATYGVSLRPRSRYPATTRYALTRLV